MRVRILGAHNRQSRHTRPVSILVDDVLCIDAGAISAALTFEEQARVRAVLLTHRHFDHVQGLPAWAMNTVGAGQPHPDSPSTSHPSPHAERGRSEVSGAKSVYALAAVLDLVKAHLLNGVLYPTFTEASSLGPPSLELIPVEPLAPFEVAGYRVLAVPTVHSGPNLGYYVTSPDGRSVFYTSDTRGQLEAAWPHVDPHLLITEVTFPNSHRGTAKHMAPADLEEALRAYIAMKGSAPRVPIVHMTPSLEEKIRREVSDVADRLGVRIDLAYEDMAVEV